MSYQSQVYVPRWRALRAILTRRGLVLTLRVEADGPFIASVDTMTPPRPKARWHDPEEVWGP